MEKEQIVALVENTARATAAAMVKNALQVSEKADKYGTVFTVRYSLPGSSQVHTIMGGDKASLIASAEKHIADYEKRVAKFDQANKQKYGPA